MDLRKKTAWILIFILAGCQSAPATSTPIPTPALWSPPAPTLSLVFSTPAVSKTPSPAPTAPALIYKVAKGDTFISIAVDFGITVDALRAANPDVQELFLSIGQALVIPVQTGTPAAARPSPTPSGVQAGPVQCYLQATGGEWCIVLVGNPGAEPVEGVQVRFSLYAAAAGYPLLARETALSVDRLLPGERAPAAVFIAPAEREGGIARAEVVSAVPSAENDQTVPVSILQQISNPLDRGLEVKFDVRIAASASVPAKRIEAVITLLDSAGNPVGFRRMRAEGEWQPGDPAGFTLRAYTLGGAIGKYELLVHAFP